MRPRACVPSRALALALLPVAAGAPAADLEWAWTVEAGQRTLSERSPSGQRLVREHGPLARVRLGAVLQRGRGPAAAAQVALGHAQLGYDGQTQAGQPVSATTQHRQAEWVLMSRPLPGAAWGEVWFSLEGQQVWRKIGAGSAAGALAERSTQVLPGVLWRGPAWAPSIGGGATLRPEVKWRTSVRHRVHVDYLGAYDGSAFDGGRRRELLLGAELASGTWRWGVRWSRAHDPASAAAPLYRAGTAVGAVRQPDTRVEEMTLSLTRSF